MSEESNINFKPQLEEKKIGEIDFLETLLYEWIRRSLFYPKFRLSNAILQSIGNKFKYILKIKPDEFEANLDWVRKFRQTYNIQDVNKQMIEDIGYKCRKCISPGSIYNDLEPQWQALDPKAVDAPIITFEQKLTGRPTNVNIEVLDADLTEIKTEIKEECVDFEDAPSSDITQLEKIIEDLCSEDCKDKNKKDDELQNEFFDFEEELPTSTIFGRHLSKLLVSPKKKSKIDHFQPMVVCTDPKTTKLSAMEEQDKPNTSQENLISPNTLEKEKTNKVEVLINRKSDNRSYTPNQIKLLGEVLKDIVRDPKPTQIVHPTPSVPIKTSQQKTHKTPVLIAPKPASNYEIEKNNQVKSTSTLLSLLDPSSTDKETLTSSKKTTKKPRRKRIRKPSPDKSTTNKTSPIETINRIEASFEITTKPLPTETITKINNRTLPTKKISNTSKIPKTTQPTCSSNSQINIVTTNLQNITQPSLISPNMLALNMVTPNQKTTTIPVISPTRENPQPTAVVQPSTLAQPNSFAYSTVSFEQPNASFPQPNVSSAQSTASFSQPNSSFLQTINASGEPTTLQPVIIHFHPSMLMQTPPNLSAAELSPTKLKTTSSAASVSEENPTNQITQFINILPHQIFSPTPTITPMTKKKLCRFKLPEGKGTRFTQRQPLKTQEEVVKCIKLMEDFAMLNENFRLIGFLERLEKHVNVVKK